MKKRAYFFVDDVIWVFRDLARKRPASLFDNEYMKGLKFAHDNYGLKVQLNIFTRTDFYYGVDEFNLSEMPDIYKKEWIDNADWIKFGFHSRQEFPDYPFVNATYEDVDVCYKEAYKEVCRFADASMMAKAVCTHWLPMSKAGCQALYDNGCTLISASYGEKTEYTGDASSLPYGHAERLLNNRQPETGVFKRVSPDAKIAYSICGYNHISTEDYERTLYTDETILDKETGVRFKKFWNGVVLNLNKKEEVKAEVEKGMKGSFLGCATHEQYFYSDYFAYQPDYMEKINIMAETAMKNGYEFFFIEELV